MKQKLMIFISLFLLCLTTNVYAEDLLHSVTVAVGFENTETKQLVAGVTYGMCTSPDCDNKMSAGSASKGVLDEHLYLDVEPGRYYIVVKYTPLGCQDHIESYAFDITKAHEDGKVEVIIPINPIESGQCQQYEIDEKKYKTATQSINFVDKEGNPIYNVEYVVQSTSGSNKFCTKRPNSLNTHLATSKPQIFIAQVRFSYYIYTTSVPDGYEQLECQKFVSDGVDKYYTLYRTGEVEKTPEVETNDFANFVINGEKVTETLGVFLENDRTYIELEKLCDYLHCNYEMKDNVVSLNFDINSSGSNNLFSSDTSEAILSGTGPNISFVINHEIGSKSYDSFLKVSSPSKIFALESPTFNEKNVDVVSKVIDDKVYVPLRFVSEAIGRYVTYEPGEDGKKPTITISSFGEGSFYEQYDVKISKNNIPKSSYITGEISDSVISLKQNQERLYVYSVKDNRLIVDFFSSIFFPLVEINETEELKVNKNVLNTNYSHNVLDKFQVEKNYVYNINTADDSGKIPFLAIANIEGYPFIKTVYLEY